MRAEVSLGKLVSHPLGAASRVSAASLASSNYRAPTPSGYRETQRLLPGAPVSPAAFPDVVLGVAEILGVD